MMKESKKIFIVTPFRPEYDDVCEVIRNSTLEVSKIRNERIDAFRLDDMRGDFDIMDELYNSINESDMLICDVSNDNPNVYYEIGYAHGRARSVLLICQKGKSTPFNLKGYHIVFYDRNQLHKHLFPRLVEEISYGLDNPVLNRLIKNKESKKNKVFISYSHKDTELLDRLLVHLKPLEKEGVIDTWDDTKIKVGEKWREKIAAALNEAKVAILLISADFLASDFIIENELPPILESAEEKGMKIIPVILRPCRFARDKNLAHFQALNDPQKPLVTLSAANQEIIYDNLSALVESYLT